MEKWPRYDILQKLYHPILGKYFIRRFYSRHNSSWLYYSGEFIVWRFYSSRNNWTPLFFLPVSSKFNISSRESLSISIFNRSWLRIKNTVAVHKARPGFFGASFNSAKNWFIVPWALKCIRNEASIHLEAKSTVDKHLVLVFCLICNPSRIHSTLSSNSWDSPESWIWWACVKIIKKCKQRLIYLSIVKYN